MCSSLSAAGGGGSTSALGSGFSAGGSAVAIGVAGAKGAAVAAALDPGTFLGSIRLMYFSISCPSIIRKLPEGQDVSGPMTPIDKFNSVKFLSCCNVSRSA